MLKLKINEEGLLELPTTRSKKRESKPTGISVDKKTTERLAGLRYDLTRDDLLNEIMDKIMELYMEFAEDEEAINERRLQSMKAFSEE